MKIETRKIREGEGDYIGDILWICHYFRPDLDKKALRNVPPTKVMARPISELPINKNVYYSGIYFSPLNKSGQPSAKVISPVDNTGYRSRCGNELDVFTDESECVIAWNKQIDEVCTRIEAKELIAAAKWREMRHKLRATKRIKQ